MQIDAMPSRIAGRDCDTRACVGPILTVALVARLWLIWANLATFPKASLFHKGLELGFLAQSIADGHGLSSPFGGNTGASAYLAPGYPFLIGAIFKAFGPFTLASAIAVMCLQVAFSLTTLWLLMQISERIADARTANLAGMFWALSPLSIAMPTFFWETSLSAMLITGWIAIALRSKSYSSNLKWVVMGGYCAIASLVNPALLPTMFAIATLLLWRNVRIVSRRWFALGVLTFLMIYAPWPIRNAVTLHTFIPTRSNLGFELWNGNSIGGGGVFQDKLHPSFNQKELSDYNSMGEVEYMRQKTELAKASIRTHPREFLIVSLKRVGRFWSGMGPTPSSTSPPIVLHIAITTLFAIIGISLLLRRCPQQALFLVLPMILFPLPYYITHADFRFRLVIDPIMTVLSSYAVTHLWDLRRSRKVKIAKAR